MFWAAVRRWVRVLWVSRVSVASCLAGAVLFLWVVQARDLLLETPGSTADELDFFIVAEMAIFAALFGLVLLVVWAAPVHAVARICLNRTEWLKSPYEPNLKAPNLDETTKAFETPAKLVPRILGCACFVVAAIGAVLAGFDLPRDRSAGMNVWLHPALYVFFLACFFAVFLAYALYRRRLSERLLARRGQTPVDVSGKPRPTSAAGTGRTGPIEFWDRVIVWVLTAALFAILAFTTLLELVPRAFLVLVLLGVWVPLLGFLGSRSFMTRVPLIATFIAVIALLDFWIGDNHDLDKRSIRNISGPQLPIRDAVDRWRTVNGCADSPGNCPSPIIVVAAGGASRAAFMTASTLGLLLDASCFDAKPETANTTASSQCEKPPAMAQRLFAISSVSGSSLGATVYAKAYADGISETGGALKVSPPCKSDVSSKLWFGKGQLLTWRDCLQAILAEDFLSPVFAGLGFRDVFAFVGKIAPNWWLDRGHLIEQSWNNAYNRFVPPHPVKVGETVYTGLDAPFMSLLSEDNNSPWRPLLLLNATSVETRRRIVTSHIAPEYVSNPVCPVRTRRRDIQDAECQRLLTDAYDMHEVLNVVTPGNCKPATVPLQLGFSLAAAAHNSARFPVVSPAGNLLRQGDAKDKSKSLGRVVDGGYFDNYGALTAFDLADTLRWDFDLHPFVLLITNDPTDNPNQKPPSDIKGADHMFASLVAAPVDTILAARSGHGSTAVKFLRGLVDPQMPGQGLRGRPAGCHDTSLG